MNKQEIIQYLRELDQELSHLEVKGEVCLNLKIYVPEPDYLLAGIEVPEWIEQVPAVKDPWFVAGLNNLKAIAIVESPLAFRYRKIFVMENFLFRI